MGRVFTIEEIESGRIPKHNSFDRVANRIRSQLIEMPQVKAAMIFGSYAKRRHNIRSDIDCLIVYDWPLRPELARHLGDIHCLASRLLTSGFCGTICILSPRGRSLRGHR
jgi:predicted nucleotidyltransferase